MIALPNRGHRALRRLRREARGLVDALRPVAARPLAPGRDSTEVCLYSPADLNIVNGSSVWLQSTAEVLLAGPRVRVTLPLRCPPRRDLVIGPLVGHERLTLVDPRRQRADVPPSGLTNEEALDLIERLDRERPFDVILVRSFATCRVAVRRRRLAGRVWACYILEPERDPADPRHAAELTTIAARARYVVVQSEEMRDLFLTVVPAARTRTIVLPPAVPPPRPRPADGQGTPMRLLYAGKFHPFYPVDAMVGYLTALRPRFPDLELHVLGDLFMGAPSDPWVSRLRHLLTTTPGVVWHGALSRAEASEVLEQGGLALSLWDHRHGSPMNDLVVSTKLLDYCAAGLPVVLTRTLAQEAILGRDYPLFVDRLEEALQLVERALVEADLRRTAAARCRAAVERFTYPAVYARLAPWLEGPGGVGPPLGAES